MRQHLIPWTSSQSQGATFKNENIFTTKITKTTTVETIKSSIPSYYCSCNLRGWRKLITENFRLEISRQGAKTQSSINFRSHSSWRLGARSLFFVSFVR